MMCMKQSKEEQLEIIQEELQKSVDNTIKYILNTEQSTYLFQGSNYKRVFSKN